MRKGGREGDSSLQAHTSYDYVSRTPKQKHPVLGTNLKKNFTAQVSEVWVRELSCKVQLKKLSRGDHKAWELGEKGGEGGIAFQYRKSRTILTFSKDICPGGPASLRP